MNKRTKIKIFALVAIVLLVTAGVVVFLIFYKNSDPGLNKEEMFYQGDASKINKTPEQAETFVVASSRVPMDVRPYMHETEVGYAISHLVYEPLVDVTTDAGIKPVLAQSVTFSTDGLTASVALKETIFSDGSKLTADDVVNSYKTFFSQDSPYYDKAKAEVIKGYYEFASGSTDEFSGIKKVSETVVEFSFTSVSAKNIYALDVPVVKNGTEGYAIGTGEYIIKEIKPSISATLTRNEKSTSQKYSYKKFVFKAFSAEELEKAVKSFDVDLFFTNTSNMLDIIKTGGYHNVYRMRDTIYSYIGFNMKSVMCKNENIRKAVAYAIDRAEIGKAYYSDYITSLGTVSTTKTKDSFESIYKQDVSVAQEKLEQGITELTEVMAMPADIVDGTRISLNFLCQNDSYSHGFFLNFQEVLLNAKIGLTVVGVDETNYVQTLANMEGFDVYHRLNTEQKPMDIIENIAAQDSDLNQEYKNMIKEQYVSDYTKLLDSVESFVDNKCLLIPTFTDDYYVAALADIDTDLILPLILQ